jgi:hypothetical protein
MNHQDVSQNQDTNMYCSLTAIMFAAGPILAEQAFAHSGKDSGDYNTLVPHYPNNFGGVYYGPCFQEFFL